MKNWKKILNVLLVPAMALTMCFSAAAEGGYSGEPKEDVSLVKELKRESGLEIPELTFNFSFASCEIGKVADSLPEVTASADLQDRSITYDAKSTEASKSIALTNDIKTAASQKGTYAWAVTEISAVGIDNKTEILENDESTLYLFAFVTEKEETEGELEWKFLVYKEMETDGETRYEKLENVIFTNRYWKQVVLEFTNEVHKETESGDHIKTEVFNYEASFTKSQTVPMKDDTFYYHVVTEDQAGEAYDIFAKDADPEVGTIGEKLSFDLKDGEKLIVGICAGNTMTVVQKAKETFKPSAKYGTDRSDATSVHEISADRNTDLTISNVNISGKGFFADFLNIKGDMPITGMVIHVLPFVVLIAAGIGILGFFFVSSRRRED